MPIYEYTCASCEAGFEQLVRTVSSEAPVVKCPSCGSTKTRRVMSVFAVGAETNRQSAAAPAGQGGCGRCGGPGPCPSGY